MESLVVTHFVGGVENLPIASSALPFLRFFLFFFYLYFFKIIYSISSQFLTVFLSLGVQNTLIDSYRIEENVWYYLIFCWGWEEFHAFPKGVSPKVNVSRYWSSNSLTLWLQSNTFYITHRCMSSRQFRLKRRTI